MADNAQKYIMKRVVDANGNLVTVHPETEAGQVLYSSTIGQTTVTNVDQALGALATLAQNSGVTSVNGQTGAVVLDKASVGLGNVDNTSDASKPVSTAQSTAISSAKSGAIQESKSYTDTQLTEYLKTNTFLNTYKGKASGVAELDSSGKVPTSQLPSYVDDVLEYTNLAGFPTTGEAGKIYVDKQTNKTYRWSGSGYTEISASLALGETSSTAYAGDKGKANATAIGTLQTKVGTLETADTNNVKLTGDQTIAGTKKFSSTPQFLNGALISAGKALTFEVSNQNTNKVTIEVDDRSSNQSLMLPNASGTLALDTLVSQTASGLMSSTDKKKLDGIATGATANTGTVTSVTISAGTGISVSSTSAITTSGTRTISLADSGVTAGQYSAVNVDAKGRVTAGGNSIEWGTSSNNSPSDALMVNGLFFELVE